MLIASLIDEDGELEHLYWAIWSQYTRVGFNLENLEWSSCLGPDDDGESIICIGQFGVNTRE